MPESHGIDALDVNLDAFMAEDWQQRVRFFKGALSGFMSPIDGDDLAGLAMEDGVDSRIITLTAEGYCRRDGPFVADSDFQAPGAWTLLVQGVDRWIPEVAQLRRLVSFLPSWRFDDVMVSYATPGGGVGPHFDQYDVFLLQGLGRRTWHIGPTCDTTTPTDLSSGVPLVDPYQPIATYQAEPGDVLYIPPGVAHWGIAESECLTFSLGFRALPIADLMARLTDHMLEKLDTGLLLEDRHSLVNTAKPGKLSDRYWHNARSAIDHAVAELDSGAWLAEQLSEISGDAALTPETMPLPDRVGLRYVSSIVWQTTGRELLVAVNGERYRYSKAVEPALIALTRSIPLSTQTLSHAERDVVTRLWSLGLLADWSSL
jgi:50S ribosomal protein L16 3-hydroxylase